MKIEVNIERRYFFILLSVILLVGTGIFVYAYNPAFNKGSDQPPIFGHSSDEVNIKYPSSSSNNPPITLQQAIDNKLFGSAVSKRYICDGNSAGVVNSKYITCDIPESNRWAGCFISGFEAVKGSGAFDDGCYVTKLNANSPWRVFINQDGGENIRCSIKCITGNDDETLGSIDLTEVGTNDYPLGGDPLVNPQSQ